MCRSKSWTDYGRDERDETLAPPSPARWARRLRCKRAGLPTVMHERVARTCRSWDLSLEPGSRRDESGPTRDDADGTKRAWPWLQGLAGAEARGGAPRGEPLMLQAKPPRFPCPAGWPVHHVSRLTFSVVRSGRIWPPILVPSSLDPSRKETDSLPAAFCLLPAALWRYTCHDDRRWIAPWQELLVSVLASSRRPG